MGTNYNRIHKDSKPKSASPVEKVKNDVLEPKKQRMAEVISRGKLNVRESASKDSRILCTVDPGNKLLIESMGEEWVRIYTESGMNGFVMKEFIKEV